MSSLSSLLREQWSRRGSELYAVFCLVSLLACGERGPTRSEPVAGQTPPPRESSSRGDPSRVEPTRMNDCSTDAAWASVQLGEVLCVRTSTSGEGHTGYSVCEHHGQLDSAGSAIPDGVIRLHPRLAEQVRSRGSPWVGVRRMEGIDLSFCAEVTEVWQREGDVTFATSDARARNSGGSLGSGSVADR